MATTTASSSSSTSLVLFLFLHLLLSVSSSAPPSTTTAQAKKSLCDTTPYPDLCRDATSQALLHPAGAAINGDTPTLARSVLGQCLTSAMAARDQVKGISDDIGTSPAGSCLKGMADSVDELAQAVQELRCLQSSLRIPCSGGGAASLGSVQDKAGSANTRFEDCSAALWEVPGVKVLDVADTVMRAMQMTSNAMVFLDALAPTKH